ncbi:MAG TPA: alanine racemase [Microbacteriaceae bacterium]|nr:alanine racemase [Microbacteriaceae bacterium]HQX35502.1 alanine racemase [Microbacteriaceae bacterium]HQZ48402.1 alanine racemase [Microbacteriaceae bacterium]HRA09299.1 alanine racemase [Microbacteriaceae bacterium]
MPWRDPASYWGGMTRAIDGHDGAVAAINLAALRYNAHDLVVRAAGTPIRVASKSIRIRAVADAVLALPGFAGILAFTLPEALWLASHGRGDIVLGYPSVDSQALAALAADPEAAARITLMVDDTAQLDAVDAVVAPSARPRIRVAIDADASWRAPGLGNVGVRRSPVHTPSEVVALAQKIAARPGFTLVGLMMYEAQIAGQTDNVRGAAAENALMRWMKRRSIAELADRRGAIVAGVREVAPLEFVNAGGTGSIESSAADAAVTEVTAGSGILAGHLFDSYEAFDLAPAAAFSMQVVRKPTDGIATILGGGWIASGPPAASRQPLPVWPAGLHTLGREGAGEVQTPLEGDAARALRVGDRVWLRHSKSGELSERVNEFQVVDGDRVVATLPTYRGEGKAFL